MALQDLNFTEQEEGVYESAPFQLNDDCGIHIEMPPAPEGSFRGNSVQVFQSMTDTLYSSVDFSSYISTVYDKALTGVIPGMYIKIVCSQMPTMAKILTK